MYLCLIYRFLLVCLSPRRVTPPSTHTTLPLPVPRPLPPPHRATATLGTPHTLFISEKRVPGRRVELWLVYIPRRACHLCGPSLQWFSSDPTRCKIISRCPFSTLHSRTFINPFAWRNRVATCKVRICWVQQLYQVKEGFNSPRRLLIV